MPAPLAPIPLRLHALAIALVLGTALPGCEGPGSGPDGGGADGGGEDGGSADGGEADGGSADGGGADGGGREDGGGSDGGTDGGGEVLPSLDAPWLRDEVAAPGSISLSEILYHPAEDGDLEWIELYNPMALDMDLSGWSLEDGVSFTFAPGTVLAAGAFLVIAADPALLMETTGLPTVLGPYAGHLSNGGERITLRSNGGRIIDTVAFGDEDPWPVAADGSGLSLSKRDPVAWSDHAENWTVSSQLGGTPGGANQLDPLAPPELWTLVPEHATWRYDLSGDHATSDWAGLDFDDSDWEEGEAPFYAGAAEASVAATAWVTADNHFALYLGQADGTDLRLVGEDSDADWTTVEEFDLEIGPWDHLFLAAWEASGDSGSPQMAIAELALPDLDIGTDAAGFEWVLGPPGACPGPLPPNPAPEEEDLFRLVEAADADGTWAMPEAEALRGTSPWGGTVGGLFTDVSHFIWADTFDPDSVTNVDDSFSLFRSLDVLVPAPGRTELSLVPTTSTFRTAFEWTDPSGSTVLHLACKLDDGAVVYLNGVEVLRRNMPTGTVDAATLAERTVDAALEVSEDIPADALRAGTNVLAAELHQATPGDPDLVFGCTLEAETWPETLTPPVLFNELPPATDRPFWVELRGQGATPAELGGLRLVSSEGDEATLPEGSLAPEALLLLDELALAVEPGDVLFLYSADGERLLDAVRLASSPRARLAQGGPWRVPPEASPGGDNLFDLFTDVVIHEVQYHRAPLALEGEPVVDRTEEWIELYNRGEVPVDLGGWQLVDAVTFLFPEGTVIPAGGYLVVAGDAKALRAQYPDIEVLGDFEGRLGNDGERILLRDAVGNPVDELPYFDGGRWPAAADGGGSSLELRDPWADNAAAEAWAASDEGDRAGWASYRIRGEAAPSAVGPDGAWDELVLGLLDAGELLIDDLRVVQDPDTHPVQLVQNGSFEDDAHWRLLGNHRHGGVVPDPEDPSNGVLRLRATGPTGHMHNHAETTLAAPIGTRDTEISFRARWVSGSPQLHSRLYFNRLPHTTLVLQPELSGTPGAPNSTRTENLGPTFADLAQDEAVPDAGEAVLLSVSVDDPDGVAGVTLWTSVDGGPWLAQAMAEGAPGRWWAEREGEAAGAVVQFYVEATDARGASASFPAGGREARALYAVDDGEAATHGLHNLRILMTPPDIDWLHQDVNLMSDDLVGATVVYDEREVFYDVGVRLKGSERGRPTESRLGYALQFHAEQPFRGSHGSVLIDRSEGTGFGQREVLHNLVMTHAGSVSGEHNDLIQLIAPRAAYTGTAELQLDRFSDLVLAAQFEDGDKGTRFEYELVYYPLTTDDGTDEGLKLPQPDEVIGTAITDLGDDQEAYRWSFLIGNNLREDDYTGLIELCQAFSLPGSELLEVADEVIDVEQWLRATAFATLSGATDQYGGAGSQHNAVFYVRPSDGRLLYFPHDLDFIGGSTMPVVGNSDLARLLQDPVLARSYYGHLQDIIARAYNGTHLAPWCAQLGALLPGQDFASHCAFVDARAAWVLEESPDAVMVRFPPVDFQITTSGGEDFVVTAPSVTLRGEAWVDVRAISLETGTAPLDLTWLGAQDWQVRVPLVEGANELTLVATDLWGEVVGTDRIVVTSKPGG